MSKMYNSRIKSYYIDELISYYKNVLEVCSSKKKILQIESNDVLEKAEHTRSE